MPERLVGRRCAPDHRAPKSKSGHALQLARAVRDVFKRNQSDADQAVGIVFAKVGQPVVIDFETGGLQLSVVDTEQRHPQCGVKHLGHDTVDLLVLKALRRIPMALGIVTLGLLDEIDQLPAAASRSESPGDGKRPDSGTDENIAALAFGFDYAGSAFL